MGGSVIQVPAAYEAAIARPTSASALNWPLEATMQVRGSAGAATHSVPSA